MSQYVPDRNCPECFRIKALRIKMQQRLDAANKHVVHVCVVCNHTITTNSQPTWNFYMPPRKPAGQPYANTAKNPWSQATTAQQRSKPKEMKEIHIRKLYNDTIIELQLITQFKTGWFAANVKPIVDAMKGFIPSTSREYDPVTKLWNVGAEFWNPLEIMLKGMGWTIVDKTNSVGTAAEPKVHVPKDYEENFYRKAQPVVRAVDVRSIAQQLSGYLGIEITTQDIKTLKSLYRQKARELHPDLGGDAKKMSELNRLWSLYTAGGNVK